MWTPSGIAEEADARGNLWCNTVVSLRHRVLFVSVPKAACTFFRAIMHRAEGLRAPPMWSLHHHDHRSFGYLCRLTDFEPGMVSEIMTSPDWWRFTVVRNPYSRLVSAYQNKISNRDQQFSFFRHRIIDWSGFEKYATDEAPARAEAKNSEGDEHGVYDEAPEPEQRVPFAAFIEYVCQQPNLERDYHWRLQASIAMPDVFRFHMVGRFENLHMDAIAVMRRLGIVDESVLGQKINASEHASDAVWDERLAALVAASYRHDFEWFHYDVDSWR